MGCARLGQATICLRDYWNERGLNGIPGAGQATTCLRGYWNVTGIERRKTSGQATICLRGYWNTGMNIVTNKDEKAIR